MPFYILQNCITKNVVVCMQMPMSFKENPVAPTNRWGGKRSVRRWNASQSLQHFVKQILCKSLNKC